MGVSDAQYATEKLAEFKSVYQIDLLPDWGEEADGSWKKGKWTRHELDKIHSSVVLLAGVFKPEKAPGRQGRLPGNAWGYFYGDKPSSSDWNFNRREDFAESVAMYIGWKKTADLYAWAEARIQLHLLENGASDPRFGVDNWAEYRRYFHPDDGDYSKIIRWQFIDSLLNGRMTIS